MESCILLQVSEANVKTLFITVVRKKKHFLESTGGNAETLPTAVSMSHKKLNFFG